MPRHTLLQLHLTYKIGTRNLSPCHWGPPTMFETLRVGPYVTASSLNPFRIIFYSEPHHFWKHAFKEHVWQYPSSNHRRTWPYCFFGAIVLDGPILIPHDMSIAGPTVGNKGDQLMHSFSSLGTPCHLDDSAQCILPTVRGSTPQLSLQRLEDTQWSTMIHHPKCQKHLFVA